MKNVKIRGAFASKEYLEGQRIVLIQSDSLVLQGENNATKKRKKDCLHEVFKRDSANFLVELKSIHKSCNRRMIVKCEQC